MSSFSEMKVEKYLQRQLAHSFVKYPFHCYCLLWHTIVLLFLASGFHVYTVFFPMQGSFFNLMLMGLWLWNLGWGQGATGFQDFRPPLGAFSWDNLMYFFLVFTTLSLQYINLKCILHPKTDLWSGLFTVLC